MSETDTKFYEVYYILVSSFKKKLSRLPDISPWTYITSGLHLMAMEHEQPESYLMCTKAYRLHLY